MSTRTETKTIILCPECGGDVGAIDHLLGEHGRWWGPWFCGGCGLGVCGEVAGPLVLSSPATGPRSRKHTIMVALRVEGSEPPVRFVAVGMAWGPADNSTPPEGVTVEGQRYFYEEHTCPSNLLDSSAHAVAQGQELDPHGVFKVEAVKYVGPGDVDCYGKGEAFLAEFLGTPE